MTPCIVYRQWHVRAILWRAVWEIDELAKDCSITEVTEERELINDHRLARKRSGRRLGNVEQECSVFHVFGAPKKINVCGRVTVERTRTRTQQRRLFHRTCVRSLEETAGAAAIGCIGSVLSWDLGGEETGPRCRPRDMRCDIEGLFHLRYTRLDPSGHGKTSGMDQMSPNRTRPRSIIFLSFPLGGLLLSPTTVVDVQPPPDLGLATRSSVPAIL
jgi:hypothetical protein